MKMIKTIFNLLFVVFTVGCSTIYGVQYDYDQKINFSDLKTFDWMPVPDKPFLNSLVVENIKNTVNLELKTKGLAKTSDNPDFLIVQHFTKKDKLKVIDSGHPYGLHIGYRGYHGRYLGWRSGRISTYEYEEGSLILDFVDAESKKLIWRGVAKAEVQNISTPEKREMVINAAVKEILKKYPPSF